jgi:hypothetical protein
MSCSLGISIFPEHGTDGETLIKNADAAMYSAKDDGRNNFRFFTEDMNAQVVERLTLESSLRSALEKTRVFSDVSTADGYCHWKNHRDWKHSSAGNTRNWAWCRPISSYELPRTAV